MTLDQLKNLSDAELNAMVARRKGWKEVAVVAHAEFMHPPGQAYLVQKIPDYCGDIEAAWDLVEEVNANPDARRADGLSIANVFYEQLRIQAGTVRLCRIVGLLEGLNTKRAIVLAWLLAMGEGGR